MAPIVIVAIGCFVVFYIGSYAVADAIRETARAKKLKREEKAFDTVVANLHRPSAEHHVSRATR
jgi:hypothetical protein